METKIKVINMKRTPDRHPCTWLCLTDDDQHLAIRFSKPPWTQKRMFSIGMGLTEDAAVASTIGMGINPPIFEGELEWKDHQKELADFTKQVFSEIINFKDTDNDLR